MSKFWQKKYTSKYTGREIDAAVGKAGNVPDVTSADAGKALVVDDEGKIVPGEAGGGGTFAVTITWNDDEEELLVVDKTFSEIKQAAAEGKYVYIIDSTGDLDYNTMPLTGNGDKLVFSGVSVFDGNSTYFYYQQVQIQSNNILSVWNGTIPITPDQQ